MVKICQTGLLKLNFETRHFPVFAKNFRRPWMKLKIFVCQFPNSKLGCQGWVVIPQNVKKSQNHCTLLTMELEFIWAPYAQLYSLAETPQPPPPTPPPAFGLI